MLKWTSNIIHYTKLFYGQCVGELIIIRVNTELCGFCLASVECLVMESGGESASAAW